MARSLWLQQHLPNSYFIHFKGNLMTYDTQNFKVPPPFLMSHFASLFWQNWQKRNRVSPTCITRQELGNELKIHFKIVTTFQSRLQTVTSGQIPCRKTLK
jgi:hypothetical protein